MLRLASQTFALGIMMLAASSSQCAGAELPAALSQVMGSGHVAVMQEAESADVRGEFNVGIITNLLALTRDGQFTGLAGGEVVAYRLVDRGTSGLTVSAATAGTASQTGAPKAFGVIQSNVSSQFGAAISATGNINRIKATLLPGQFSVQFR